MINRVIVQNNPLKYTDPSGHGWFKRLRKAVSRVFRSVRRTVQSALSKPVVKFAIAAAVGIATGYVASAYIISTEGILGITASAVIGAAAAADSYYQFSSKAISNVISGRSRSSGIQTDGGTLISTSSPVSGFNGLGGKYRSNSPSGLEASTPKVNPTEQAERSNKKSLQKSLSVDMEGAKEPWWHIGTIVGGVTTLLEKVNVIGKVGSLAGGALSTIFEPGGPVKMTGMIAGGITGAKFGAYAGTFVTPGVGTFIGGFVGGIVGGIIGGSIGSYFDDPNAGQLY